ncbi:LytTR family DNA-binding domain-containing protein [Sporosarcina sp. FSL W7-1349]|uniref:LytR/AlgR family response regulator transcription factor n=1 Tax=Sporosarcina sp. FSL W7-1349 TaxID=2921561 RepID=UPI0030F89965
MVQIKVGERIKNIKIEDVYYIETSAIPHRLTLYERHGYYEFYGKLIDFEALGEPFYRSHKSFLINLCHVKELNKKERTVTMANGDRCLISFRAFRELGRRLSHKDN